jgi:alkylmercury lyase
MNIDDVTQRILAWLMPLEASPACYQPAVAMVRCLAEGRALSRSEAAALLGCREADVDVRLAEMGICAERDDHGAIVGAGLSLRPTRHQFNLDGKRLFTWCALDTFVFSLVLDRTAFVTSTCPATGRAISLRVSSRGLSEVNPSETVLSVIVPTGEACDVRESFCTHSNFFISPSAAKSWVREHSTGAILNLDEGFELARRIARLLYSGPRVASVPEPEQLLDSLESQRPPCSGSSRP